MREAVIVDAVRTPIGKRGGGLADIHPVDLTAEVLRTLQARTGLDPSTVDDVIWGVVNQLGDQSTNLGRLGALAAGWPVSVPGTTIDRACGSSQQAVHFAAATVISGQADLVIAGGTEMMSRVPLGAARATGTPFGATVLDRFGVTTFNQGLGAEAVATKFGLTRADLDAYAAESHERSARAWDAGAFEEQLVDVSSLGSSLRCDEGIRVGTTAESMAHLNSPFLDDGIVHAGNSSQISDGAAGLVITTRRIAREHGWKPFARFHSGVAIGDDPVLMLTAPIPATQRVLRRAGITAADVGTFEVNEAFASVPLAWLSEFGVAGEAMNPLGGAISVGHPLGASGAILMTRMVHHMRREGIRFGLQTMCENGGMANATILELEA
jgi:acetyl-CoA acyltransferase